MTDKVAESVRQARVQQMMKAGVITVEEYHRRTGVSIQLLSDGEQAKAVLTETAEKVSTLPGETPPPAHIMPRRLVHACAVPAPCWAFIDSIGWKRIKELTCYDMQRDIWGLTYQFPEIVSRNLSDGKPNELIGKLLRAEELVLVADVVPPPKS